MHWEILPDGSVHLLEVKGVDKAISGCMHEILAKLRFPTFRAGEESLVNYEFKLVRPKSGQPAR